MVSMFLGRTVVTGTAFGRTDALPEGSGVENQSLSWLGGEGWTGLAAASAAG